MLWGLLGQKRAITVNHGMGQAQNQSIFFCKNNRSRSEVKRFDQNIKWFGQDTNVFLFQLFFTNKGHFQLAKTVTRKISTQRLYTWYDILQVICIVIALRGSRYLKETLLTGVRLSGVHLNKRCSSKFHKIYRKHMCQCLSW